MSAPDWLRRALRGVARAGGYDVVRSAAARRAQVMRDLAITEVFDVGANEGQFAGELRRAGYTGRIVSFEPLSEAFAKLRDASRLDKVWSAVNVAIGDRKGSAELHVARNSQSSSFLSMLAAHERSAPSASYVRTEVVRVEMLDEMFADHHEPNARAMLKLDVQGFEQRILSASPTTLSQVDAVQAEMSLVPLYDGEALVEETLALLRARGFCPVMLERTFSDPATGHALQVDGLFVRTKGGASQP